MINTKNIFVMILTVFLAIGIPFTAYSAISTFSEQFEECDLGGEESTMVQAFESQDNDDARIFFDSQEKDDDGMELSQDF
ncbi:MAG: hypothetical protein K5989_02895 [Lachnospiraceae bacterium]|nr:hypothetical protein [Lachnospiraceae bacterium]